MRYRLACASFPALPTRRQVGQCTDAVQRVECFAIRLQGGLIMSDRYIDFANSALGRQPGAASSACPRRCACNAGSAASRVRWTAHCWWAVAPLSPARRRRLPAPGRRGLRQPMRVCNCRRGWRAWGQHSRRCCSMPATCGDSSSSIATARVLPAGLLRWPTARASSCSAAPPNRSTSRSPPAPSAAWRASPVRWARKCATAAPCNCCMSATAPKRNSKARCASSFRPKAPIISGQVLRITPCTSDGVRTGRARWPASARRW